MKKVLIAGASGAIGQPLIRSLTKAGYRVFGITRSRPVAGAEPIVVDVMDRDRVFSAMEQVKPDILIDMLTRLPKEYTPQAMKEAAEDDAKIRLIGGGNLFEAAVKTDVKRTIVQSTGFWYAPGNGLAREKDPFAKMAPTGIALGCQIYEEIERRAFELDGVALRFGFFYGPGTWFHPMGNMAEQMKKKEFPLIGEGKGIWNFIHIEDAAQAIVSAIEIPTGAYNIVNDRPSPMNEWLPAFSRFVGAPQPNQISEEEALKTRGPEALYYAKELRGASNEKAKKVFHFRPRPFEWLS